MNPSPVTASARTLLPGIPDPVLHALVTNRPGTKTEDAAGFAGAAFFGVAVSGIAARQAIAAMVAYIEKRIRIPSILRNLRPPAGQELFLFRSAADNLLRILSNSADLFSTPDHRRISFRSTLSASITSSACSRHCGSFQ
jgi:hypothetical protein